MVRADLVVQVVVQQVITLALQVKMGVVLQDKAMQAQADSIIMCQAAGVAQVLQATQQDQMEDPQVAQELKTVS